MWKNESTGRVINDSHYKKLTPAHKQQYSPYTAPAEEEEKTQIKKDDDDQEDETYPDTGTDNIDPNFTPDFEGFDNEPQTDQEPDNPAEFGGFGGGDAGGGGAVGEF